MEVGKILSHAWGNDSPSIVTFRRWINKSDNAGKKLCLEDPTRLDAIKKMVITLTKYLQT